ncbi:hypothetical protein HWI79_2748 [Cryptosporidium felis]|nr:hypothetical protein HWI79_2748 [Cryptosporidium felis]
MYSHAEFSVGNDVFCNSGIIGTLSGRFFPTHQKRNSLDFSILRCNELVIFSEFLLSEAEKPDSVSFQFEEMCLDFWKYSIEESPLDFILVLDSSYNLRLFSLKSVIVPHSDRRCPVLTQKISTHPHFNNFLLNGNTLPEIRNTTSSEIGESDLSSPQFTINNESSIYLGDEMGNVALIDTFMPYESSEKYPKNNPLVREKRVNKYTIAIDSYSGLIVFSSPSLSSKILITPTFKWLKDFPHIESIELRLISENLIYFDSKKYRLETLSFVHLPSRKNSPILLYVFLDLNSNFLLGKLCLHDWENILKTHPTQKDSHFKPIFESDLFPIIRLNSINSKLSIANSFSMRAFYTCIPAMHTSMQLPHVNMKKKCVSSVPALLEAGMCDCKNLLILFSKVKSELVVIFGDFGDLLSRQERIIRDDDLKNGGCEIKVISLKDFCGEEVYVDLRNVCIIEEKWFENAGTDSTIKFLVTSICKEAFILEISFREFSLVNLNISVLQKGESFLGLSDISGVSPHQYRVGSERIVNSVLVSSKFGITKKLTFPDLVEEPYLVPKIAEILTKGSSITVGKKYNQSIVTATKRYRCYWDSNKAVFAFKYEVILRFLFLNLLRIRFNSRPSSEKRGIVGTKVLPIEENKFLVFYSRLKDLGDVELLIRSSEHSKTSYCLERVSISGLPSPQSLLLCETISHNLIIQVTETQILLIKGISGEVSEADSLTLQRQDQVEVSRVESTNIWSSSQFGDLILQAAKVNENQLFIITQEHILLSLKVNSFNNFEFLHIWEIPQVNAISSFDSKTFETLSASYTLTVIGDCENNIHCLLSDSHGTPPIALRINLEEFNKLRDSSETDMVTSVKIDTSHKNVYLVTTCHFLYIFKLGDFLELNTLQNERAKVAPRKIIDLTLQIHLENQILDWEITGTAQVQYADGIWKNQIILSSVSRYIFLELTEFENEILTATMRQLGLPNCSKITQIREDKFSDLSFLCLDGETKRVSIISVVPYLNEYCDKVLSPVQSSYDRVKTILHLKENDWLVVHLKSLQREQSGVENFVSRVFLFDTNSNLYGSKEFYLGNQNEATEMEIFPYDEKNSFFLVTYFKDLAEETNIDSTMVQMISVLHNSKQFPPFRDPFLVSGGIFLKEVCLRHISRVREDPKKYLFFLVGRGVDEEGSPDLVSTKVLVLMDISDLKKSVNTILPPEKVQEGLVRLGDYTFLQMEVSAIFTGKTLHCVGSPKDSEGNISEKKESNQLLLFLEGQSEPPVFVKNPFCIGIRKENNLQYSPCETENVGSFRLLSRNFKDSFLFQKGLDINLESKLFITGMEILINYIFKRPNKPGISSRLPGVTNKILFKVFDSIFPSISSSSAPRIRLDTSQGESKYHQPSSRFKKPPEAGKEDGSDSRPIHSFFTSRKPPRMDAQEIFRSLRDADLDFVRIFALYKQICLNCSRWRIIAVLIIWYNILNSMNSRDTEGKVKSLKCPLLRNWSLELNERIGDLWDSFIEDSPITSNSSLLVESRNKFLRACIEIEDLF